MAKKIPIVQATFYNNNTKQIENCYPMTSAKGVVMSDGKTLEESFSDKADDSVVVHKSGDEEILGRKTFDDLRANGFHLSDDEDWNRWVSAFYSFVEEQGVIQFGTEEDWSVILRNIADPEYENDVATKGYVDTKIGDASIPVLQYGALINNNIPSVFEREEHAIANAPIYAKILSGEVQFFAAKIGGVGLFVSRSISSNKSSFELIGLDFKNLAEILKTINIDQSGLTQAVTLSKNLQSALTDTDGSYGQRVAELEEGKQDTLTAGNGISIEGNVISASVAEVVDKIVNAGYVFAGVATPSTDPGTPEAKVFYIANGKGTYTNFGGLEVTEDEIVVLHYDTEWHKVATGIASNEKLTELEGSIGATFKVEAQYHNSYIAVGGFKIGDIINTKTLTSGYGYDCAIYPSSEGDIIDITGTGGYKPKLWSFLDIEKRLISTIEGNTEYNTTLVAPPNTAFVIFSWVALESAIYGFDATITSGNGLTSVIRNNKDNIATISTDLKNIISDGFSNNKLLNRMIKELYIYDITPIKNRNTISIHCGGISSSTGKYYNLIRLGVDGPSNPEYGYANLMLEYFDTQEQALAAMRGYSVISTSVGAAIVDFSSIELGSILFEDFTSKDYSKLYNAPSIAIFLGEYVGNEDNEKVLAQANDLAINSDNAYQCPDQFKAGSLVKVYRQGLLVNPSEYTLFKQGKVQFNDSTNVQPSDILFEYEKNIKHIDSLSLPLDSHDQLNYVTEDNSTQLYSFVNDPTGGEQKVMMLHCSEISASKVRMQFSLKSLNATYFHDRVKMFLPTDMKNALLSYSKDITWFSIGGAWGIFGSPTGQLNNMFSGSANSFDIYKDKEGNRLYFHQVNRRRDVNTETGLEEYTILSEKSSTFDVLDNEWITIEREWQAGNPGFCKYKITDSLGVHTMEVNPAYNVVCDPENEIQRYGNKLIRDIPYNEFPGPFVAKIYTSNEVAQHCIDAIGKIYLYFKEYELIEATAVNTY